MAGFVSKYTNRLDAKGRVSIPAPFRAVLAKDGYEGLYCVPSEFNDGIDAGGNEMIEEFGKHVKKYDRHSEDYEDSSYLLYGESEDLKIDKDGRILLPERFKEHLEYPDEVMFVGQEYKFQMWNPKKFEAHIEEVKKRKSAKKLSSKAPSKSEEQEK